MTSLFSRGFNGLADSEYSGKAGSVAEVVGVDFRSKPGLITAHQKLEKVSGGVVDELCKASVSLPNGDTLWFSSESGKVWRERGGVWSLAFTTELNPWDARLAVLRGGAFRAADHEYPGEYFRISDYFIDEFGEDIMVKENRNFIHYRDWGQHPWKFKELEVEERVDFDPNNDRTLNGFTMSASGNRIFVAGGSRIYQFNLTSFFKLSGHSLAFTKTGLAVGSAWSLRFNDSGTKMYVLEGSTVVGYDLSTPWQLSGSTHTSTDRLSVPSGYRSLTLSPDGKMIYLSEGASARANRVVQIELNTAWDLSSGSKSVRTIQWFDDRERDGSMRMQFVTVNGEPRVYVLSTVEIFSNDNIVLEYYLGDSNGEVSALDAIVHSTQKQFYDRYDDALPLVVEEGVYWTTEKTLWKVPVTSSGADWENLRAAGHFKNGDKEFHPLVTQDLRLYAGDNTDIAQVDEWGNFSPQTNFNVRAPERIQAMTAYDLDVLVGTRRGGQGRVLRWFTENESWNAEDTIEEPGINAFIHDDNFVYAQAGDHGNIYFYNGEKLERFKQIPGEYTAQALVTVHPNAVGYLGGIPVFGVSSRAGNPALQGVYGLGRYSRDYSITLSLDFPLGEMEGVEIGSILTNGLDMYVSYRLASGEVGVAKLNWEKKYDKAYFITRYLFSGEDRNTIKSISRFFVPYHSMPADTVVKVSYKSRSGDEFKELTLVKDEQIGQMRADKSVTGVANTQLRVEFVTSENNAPEVEDVDVSISGIKRSS